MNKNCVACHNNFTRTQDEPERFSDFCTDCLFKLQAAWPQVESESLPEAPDDTPRLHHNCDMCVGLQRREMDRERLGSAAAWAFLWFCAGLLVSPWVDAWLFGNAPWPSWLGF